MEPRRGERVAGICRTYGAHFVLYRKPRACARGYDLSPLRGSNRMRFARYLVAMRPGIFFDTFLESFRNKMFLVFFVASSFVIGSIGLALNMDAVNGMIRGATFFGTQLKVPAFTIREWVENLQTGLAMLTATVGLVLALMATSTLFPTMLQKGSIDLLLCRPIPRWFVITARFIGG